MVRKAGETAIVLGRSDGWGDTLAYGFAHLGKSLFWYGSEVLFAFYLTSLIGLPPQQMGYVLAIGLASSAAMDVVVGHRLKGVLEDARSAARLQLLGAVLCAGGFVAVFAGFWIPVEARFAYAVAAGLAFRATYALYDIPQGALMALATADGEARDRLAATRIWFSGAATLLIALSVGPLIAARGEDGAALFLWLSCLVAAPAVLAAGVLTWRISRAAAQARTLEAPAEPGRARLTPAFGLMIALMVITSLFTPLYAKVEPFFAAYVLRSPTLGGVIIVAMAAGLALGQPIWGRSCARLGRTRTLVIAALFQIVALTVALPFSGTPAALIVTGFVFGMGNGGVGMVLWAAFSAVVARDARGHESIAYGYFTATAKLTLAIGGLGLGAALSRFDYQGEEARRLLDLMLGVPLVGAITCLLVAAVWSRAAMPQR